MDDRKLSRGEKISAAVLLIPYFGVLGLAWWAFMYPVLGR